jgi:quercetin dioxygenase-like cupin family protein
MNRATPAHARTFSVHGVTFRSFVRSATGSTQLAAWRAEFAPRTPGRPHRMSTEEILHVLEGELHVDVDGDAVDVAAGEAVAVPPGALLTVDNRRDEPAAAWVTTPLGMTATMEADGSALTPPWAQ